MKKSHRIKLLLLFAAAIISIGILTWVNSNSSHSSIPAKPSISGAYEALNLFGMARVYPSGTLPKKAHYAAWEKLQKNRRIRKNHHETSWESIGPHNFSGRTLDLAFNPLNSNTIYAGSASGGLWRSYSAGKGTNAWEYVNTGFPVLGVSTIALPHNDSLTIYIGTGEVYNSVAAGTGAAFRSTRGSYGMGILKSTDGGRSWQKSLDWSYHQNEGVWDIKISNQNTNLLYTATTDGVYKSSHAGGRWEHILDVAMANSIVVNAENDEQILVGCGNFNSSGKGIYKSIDGGDSWIKIQSNLPVEFNGKIQLDVSPSDRDIVYTSIGNGFGFQDGATWTLRSDDFGSNWRIASIDDYSRWQGWFSHDIAVHPKNPDEIIAAGIGLWQSDDAGQNFDAIAADGLGFRNPPIAGPDGPPDYLHSDIHDVIYHPGNSNFFYVASDGGIHQTEDNGLTFTSRNSGYQTVQFYNGTSSSQLNSDFFIGGLQDNGTIAYYGSKAWTRIAGGDGSWSAIDPENDRNIIVSSQFLRMRKSSNGGEDYERNAPPSNNENTVFIAPFVVSKTNPQVIYAGRTRVYRSTDGGESWEATNGGNPLNGTNPILSLAISPKNHDVVYTATVPTTLFGGTRGQVWVTRNGGSTWEFSTGRLPDRFPMDIAVDPFNSAIAYIAFSGYGTGHVYKTTDFGETWKDVSIDLPDVPTNAIAMDPLSLNFVYIGNDLGVFFSDDGGESWRSYNEGIFEATMVFDLSIAAGIRKIRMASHGNGAFERDLMEVPVTIPEDEIFALQIFPNPAFDVVNVSYKTNTEEIHHARLLDASGRTIHTYFDEIKSPGEYKFTMDLGDLPAASYFLILQNESWLLTEKIVVVK